jgi:hypothetical protein
MAARECSLNEALPKNNQLTHEEGANQRLEKIKEGLKEPRNRSHIKNLDIVTKQVYPTFGLDIL